jgi:hypothetical protein
MRGNWPFETPNCKNLSTETRIHQSRPAVSVLAVYNYGEAVRKTCRLFGVSLDHADSHVRAPEATLHVHPSRRLRWLGVKIRSAEYARFRYFNDSATVLLYHERQCPWIIKDDLHVLDFKSRDEFYYRIPLPNGKTELRPMPQDYVMPGVTHGGFGVMDTGGKRDGYSWFIFFGPPDLRAKVPLADWDKVVEEYARTHNGISRVENAGPYPTPGRMPNEPADKKP